MLAFFVSAYPDETLESRVARYAALLAYAHPGYVAQDLFGSRHHVVATDLPYGLQTFLDQFPPGHRESLITLMNNETLLPLYAPFLPPERLTWLQAEMAATNGGRIHGGSGLMASRIPTPTYLRFCVACVAADRHTYDEAYWHRGHQTIIAQVCPQHGTPLINSNLFYSQRQQRHVYTTLEAALRQIGEPITQGQPLPYELQKHHDLLWALAQDGAWLLHNNAAAMSPAQWDERYQQLLMARGLMTYTGQIRAQALLAAFNAYYSHDLLRHFQAELDCDSDHNWLVRLLRQTDRFHHPLLHLLLMHFLGQTAASMVAYQPETNYFLSGPWPCLNPVCEQYQVRVIPTYQLAFTHDRRPVATFICSTCGLSYRRVGPDGDETDWQKISDYMAFGSVWEAKLTAWWLDEQVSLRQLARRLGVTTRTVKKQADRLNLPWPRPGHRSGQPQRLATAITKETSDTAALKARQRAEWLAVCEQNPELGMKALRKKEPALAIWLWRHDHPWLKRHQPPKQPVVSPPNRVDWKERDLEVTVCSLQAAIQLLSVSRRPNQLTRTAIERQAQVHGLMSHHRSRLPLAAQALERLRETREAYALRRIWWVARQARKQDELLVTWQLIRRAGVYRLREDETVRQVLSQAGQWVSVSGQIIQPASLTEFYNLLHLEVSC